LTIFPNKDKQSIIG